MGTLKIFCDLTCDEGVAKLLRDGIAPHQLLLPAAPAATVLAQSAPDPAIWDADICFGQPDAKAIIAAPNVRWLQVTSAGYTRYDTPEFRGAAADRKMVFTNSSSVYGLPCAEHVLAFMMAQARQLPVGLRTRCSSDAPEWARLRAKSVLLRGQKVLILGYGAIGALLLPMMRALQMEVVAFRRAPTGKEGVLTVSQNQLENYLPWADHVVNVLPENPGTRDSMNAERFAQMKQGAVFYNIGRGKTVDQTALEGALRSGRLAAAWLDVTDPEPLPEDHPLLNLPTCHLTPHTAGGHAGEHRNLVLHFLENFGRFIRGEPLNDRIL